jgi:hypothetical protein
MPIDVKCRACGGIYVETNDADGIILLEDKCIPDPRIKTFDPDVITNGAMLRLKEPYRSWGWTSFPHDTVSTRDALQCPNCMAPLPDLSGKVLLVDRQPPPHESQTKLTPTAEPQPRLPMPMLDKPKLPKPKKAK